MGCQQRWNHSSWNPLTDGPTSNGSRLDMDPMMESYYIWIQLYWKPIRDGSTSNGTLIEMEPLLVR
eukprot:3346327-Pyramimonas_sp.AAC.1